MQARDIWEQLAERLTKQEGVERGRMMSADAVTIGGKVFAFFSTKGGLEGLGAKVGRSTDASSLGLQEWRQLAPFKSKPSMKDWIVTGPVDRDRWEAVARHALAVVREGLETKS